MSMFLMPITICKTVYGNLSPERLEAKAKMFETEQETLRNSKFIKPPHCLI